VQRLIDRNAKADIFAVIAAEWLALQRKRFAPATMEKAEWTFRDLINPSIGNRPITEIMPLESLNVFRRLEERGKLAAPNSVAAKSSDTPSLLAARYEIQRRTYVAHWLQLSRRTMQRSSNHAESVSSAIRGSRLNPYYFVANDPASGGQCDRQKSESYCPCGK
jgi:hypothetical protein